MYVGLAVSGSLESTSVADHTTTHKSALSASNIEGSMRGKAMVEKCAANIQPAACGPLPISSHTRSKITHFFSEKQSAVPETFMQLNVLL